MDKAAEPLAERVAGLVERVTFHSEETGFTVLQIKAKGFRELIPVVGVAPAILPGEWLEATGRWILDREYGRQFKAEALRSTRPDTLEGIERYLGSGLIKGIGPHFAGKMVARFGKEIFEVIETRSDCLRWIKGLGEKRLRLITDAWKTQKAIRAIMVFLHSHGVGTSRAFRIYKTYGEEAIQLVAENPYRLAHDIRGIGFKTADQVAASVGIPRDSPLRAGAGVEYVLAGITEDGHCACPREDLIVRAARELDIDEDSIRTAVNRLMETGALVLRRQGERELVFLSSLDSAEENLAADLLALAAGRHPCPPVVLDRALAWVEGKTGLILAESQRQAIAAALENKIFILTGGPGTGKTTIVNGIVKILRAKGLSVSLSAPTGRAAKRLSETSGLAARTIHRLLEFDPATGGFKHGRDKPLRGDVFIVDEASMLDLPLAGQLLRALPRRSALILVGDVDQLPSVGPGMVLRDAIDSGKFKVLRLTEIFRQAARSRIVTNAHRINRGLCPEYPQARPARPGDHDFYFIETGNPEETESVLVRLASSRLREGFGLDPRRDVQVLTPMRKGRAGARNLNAVLQDTLNPGARGIMCYGENFRVGDKVMQTQNDYDKDVFNGDIGWIRELDDDSREAGLDFEGRRVVYQYEEFDELSLAYALTIHKSQGSEYPCVIIPLHAQHYLLLQRNLLYTGVTRGKRLVVLVGEARALALAVRRAEGRRRLTLLRERLAAGGTGREFFPPAGKKT
ncbi:MAG: ATP-dependent RecD-like DNA helicase [Planctomycetota bacterium]|nr:ATP-dependent RecD-like DNA helicase [Planctomycetota bacterium]